MKKLLLLLTITLMVSCKPDSEIKADEKREAEAQKTTDWKVEVKYLDKTVDTIVVRSVDAPFLYVNDHVSTVTDGDSYAPVASYVKTINILN